MIDNIINTVNGWVWSPALVGLCLLAGLYFSFGTRFVQVRRFGAMARLLFSTDKTQKTGITSFQAFAMALSGRVGTGNIVGVATAIGYGGPGAIGWNHNGEFRGGPAYYTEKGLRARWLAIIFAVCAVVACGFFLPPVQSNGIAMSFANTFHINPAWIGLGVAVLIGIVIIGGVKRIANVAQIVAPFMAILYILLSVVILVIHAGEVPAVFGDMIRSAFGLDEALGGILGSTIAWGVKRGIYSNEAGQGTAPIVAAAAKVSHPVKQGLVQAFSVYVDTLLVCTATAVMILACQTYNVYDAQGGLLVTSTVAELGEPDVSYTTAAISTLLGPGLGGLVVSFALFFFAFTTIMAYYYYAETNLVYLFGNGRKEHVCIWVLRVVLIAAVFYGSLNKASLMWSLGDIGVGTMAWINIVSIVLLSGIAFRALRSYERQKKAGKEPVFDPDELKIKNADFWKKNS